MSVILQNTEETCHRIQTMVETLPSTTFDTESLNMIKTKLENVRASVARSKKKIMVRTEKGIELSTKAQDMTSELEDAVTELKGVSTDSKSQQAAIISLIKQLEKEVRKVETYWKSYEAAIT